MRLRNEEASLWIARLAILLLPWQTRAFIDGPRRGGFAWEQGRWSVYATMGLIWLACVSSPTVRMRIRLWVAALPLWGRLCLGVFVAFLLWPTASWVATGQGSLQALTLAAFVFLLVLERRRLDAGRWFVYGLVPAAAIAILQVGAQSVSASTLFGISAQNPMDRGVSVVESGGLRFLRAYGPFPHPNLLGGWLVAGLLVLMRRWVDGRTCSFVIAGTVLLFSVALYFSFSRSAWLGLAAGLLALAGASLRVRAGLVRVVAAGALVALVFGAAFVVKPELIRTRIVAEERLERRSINERTAALGQAVTVLRAVPWGTGFEAYRVGLDHVCVEHACDAPAEPPHLVPLLVLAELGWARAAALLIGTTLIFACFCCRMHWRKLPWELLFAGAVMATFDHYLWSAWAGQALAAILVSLIVARGLDMGGRIAGKDAKGEASKK